VLLSYHGFSLIACSRRMWSDDASIDDILLFLSRDGDLATVKVDSPEEAHPTAPDTPVATNPVFPGQYCQTYQLLASSTTDGNDSVTHVQLFDHRVILSIHQTVSTA
jgi:hypothetical protein